jgi:hypothetical protein
MFLLECIIKSQVIQCIGQENGISPGNYLDDENDKRVAGLCTEILE